MSRYIKDIHIVLYICVCVYQRDRDEISRPDREKLVILVSDTTGISRIQNRSLQSPEATRWR